MIIKQSLQNTLVGWNYKGKFMTTIPRYLFAWVGFVIIAIIKRKRRVIKKGAFLLALLFAVETVGAAEADDSQSLYYYLAGSYTVVGKELNSKNTYLGKTVFTGNGNHLTVTRYIKGKTIRGTGKIETALGSDQAKVLRVRYTQEGKDYEITYLWHSDLDNYARLSGYLYERGKQTDAPGLEALFIEHPEK